MPVQSLRLNNLCKKVFFSCLPGPRSFTLSVKFMMITSLRLSSCHNRSFSRCRCSSSWLLVPALSCPLSCPVSFTVTNHLPFLSFFASMLPLFIRLRKASFDMPNICEASSIPTVLTAMTYTPPVQDNVLFTSDNRDYVYISNHYLGYKQPNYCKGMKPFTVM